MKDTFEGLRSSKARTCKTTFTSREHADKISLHRQAPAAKDALKIGHM